MALADEPRQSLPYVKKWQDDFNQLSIIASLYERKVNWPRHSLCRVSPAGKTATFSDKGERVVTKRMKETAQPSFLNNST